MFRHCHCESGLEAICEKTSLSFSFSPFPIKMFGDAFTWSIQPIQFPWFFFGVNPIAAISSNSILLACCVGCLCFQTMLHPSPATKKLRSTRPWHDDFNDFTGSPWFTLMSDWEYRDTYIKIVYHKEVFRSTVTETCESCLEHPNFQIREPLKEKGT